MLASGWLLGGVSLLSHSGIVGTCIYRMEPQYAECCLPLKVFFPVSSGLSFLQWPWHPGEDGGRLHKEILLK